MRIGLKEIDETLSLGLQRSYVKVIKDEERSLCSGEDEKDEHAKFSTTQL